MPNPNHDAKGRFSSGGGGGKSSNAAKKLKSLHEKQAGSINISDNTLGRSGPGSKPWRTKAWKEQKAATDAAVADYMANRFKKK